MSYKVEKNEKYGYFQISPTPTKEEISKFYAEEFYSGPYKEKQLNDSSLEVQEEDKEFYDFNWERVERYIQLFQRKYKQDLDTILDIGCGFGQLLCFLKEKKDYECYGFDPAPEAVDFVKSKNINAKVAGLESMNVFNMKFDIVSMINVLEHLPDPEFVIKEIHSHVLRKNGLLIIDVPNEFNDFQVAGKEVHNLNEWWIAPPGHLSYFSSTSLRNLLEKNGFEIFKMEASFPLEMFLLFGEKYVGDPILGKSCHKKRINFELNLKKQAKEDKLYAFYEALAELGLGRQLRCYARKI